MSERPFLVIDEGHSAWIAARVDAEAGSVVLSPAALEQAFGWRLEDRGLCRGDVCIPLGTRAARGAPDGIDLAGFADLLDRPLAVDAEAGAAALGTSAGERRSRLASLAAPDFTLPDLDGRPHSLSAWRDGKVLLLAWASW
jgi:hypothetical protein